MVNVCKKLRDRRGASDDLESPREVHSERVGPASGAPVGSTGTSALDSVHSLSYSHAPTGHGGGFDGPSEDEWTAGNPTSSFLDRRNGLKALLNGGARKAAENLPEGSSTMSHDGRTLVIVLSMHRSGSSLLTNILQEHGMSLGPFELVEATPNNPHGHFEVQPILDLSREVQTLACGFSEDVPGSPEIFTRFLKSDGIWDHRTEVPETSLERGRELIGRLVESGPISGFKDPRTVLIWPFWRRVLEAFPDVRFVPIVLLRTPHEIAMSLFTRSRSAQSYRTCLDVTAVHLRRLAAIVDAWPEPVARVRFGSPHYEEDLARAVASCGLDWDPEKRRRCFDAACVHHGAAVVAHESQRLHEALGGTDEAAMEDPIHNLAIVEVDASARESLYREIVQQDRARIDDLTRRTEELHTSLALAGDTSRNYYNNWQDANRSWQDAHRNWQDAHRSWQDANRSWQDAHRSWQDAIRQLEATRDELGRYRRLWEETRDVAWELSRQLDATRVESIHFQKRLLRFDSHPLLGPILRGRRHVRSMLHRLRARQGGS
jgi:hypothetical protein